MGTSARNPTPMHMARRMIDMRVPLGLLQRLSATRVGWVIVSGVALALLLIADYFSLLATGVRFDLHISPTSVELLVDGQRAIVQLEQQADTVIFLSASADEREYQIDGTDNTNNLSESAGELAGLLPTPEYQFESWVRGRYSFWSDIRLDSIATHDYSQAPNTNYGGQAVALPTAGSSNVTAWLMRPESPVTIWLLNGGQEVGSVQVDRNNRNITLSNSGVGQATLYFPLQPLPFAAELVDTLLRVMIWAWVVLVLAGVSTLVLSCLIGGLSKLRPIVALVRVGSRTMLRVLLQIMERGQRRTLLWRRKYGHLSWFDGIATLIMLAGLSWVIWIAQVQFHAEPHILDASAYYFQAKIFASGQLSAPSPADPAAFQGPFMVDWQGRWFAQYPPMTSLLLALGVLARVPWIVEPLLGTFALVGIYGLGKRLFGGPTALLALVLGALSPFYAYLAASYLSHTVALCFEVYFLWLLLIFADSLKLSSLVASAICLAAMFATRELSAVAIGIVTLVWVAAWRWREFKLNLERIIPAVAAATAILMLGLLLYMTYNLVQTGDPFLLPRLLFNPTDRYGFGPGIGFYGQHTVAAGMIVVDQLLTSLMIDLFGWPFYLTLALIPLALLRRDDHSMWDWFALTCFLVLLGVQAGYFYHGIYLGPRYLCETIPFLLWLTARGVSALARICSQVLTRWSTGTPSAKRSRTIAFGVSAGVCCMLIVFNLVFYLPRQVAEHVDFTGLPANLPVKTQGIYGTHFKNAVVITDNWMIYYYVLWPLNDPDLRGSVLYAYAPTVQDADRIASEYPLRRIEELTVDGDGSVAFVLWRS